MKPGDMVYVELPLPRVEHASLAKVRWVGLRKVYLVMGAMSGWYLKAEVGKTAEEAEAKRAELDRQRMM